MVQGTFLSPRVTTLLDAGPQTQLWQPRLKLACQIPQTVQETAGHELCAGTVSEQARRIARQDEILTCVRRGAKL